MRSAVECRVGPSFVPQRRPNRLSAGGNWLLLLLLLPQPAAADDKAARVNPAETRALQRLVERMVSGEDQPGGDAWLKWTNHFLRGSDRKTYVPFTITIDDAPGGFERVALYIRVVEDVPADSRPVLGNMYGVATGEVPVSVPERQFRRPGEPTAGENSAILQSLTAKTKKPGFPFEDVYPSARPPAGGTTVEPTEPHRIQRALAVAPGRYIVYAAVRERATKGGASGSGPGGALRTATLRRELVVPDFTQPKLQTSSIILADTVVPLATPLDRDQQRVRPYALGTTEVVPSLDTRFPRQRDVVVTFFVYNAMDDGRGKPNVTVEYRIYQAGTGDKLVASTRPVVLDATTLPANFSTRAGHQLAPMQTLALQHLGAGPYRLRIRVVDNITGEQLFDDVPFTVQGS